MYNVIWIFALGIAGWAGWLDWRSRRIPNWLTVPAFVAGIALNSAVWGVAGMKAALVGAGLGLGLLLPFVLLRGLGAGDWKLMGALGAWLGPYNIILALLGTIFVAGVMAVVQVLRSGRVKQTLANMWVVFLTLVTFGMRSSKINLDNPGLLSLPFGVAAAVATTILFCAEQAYRVF